MKQESPVKYRYSANQTRFGIILSIEGSKAKVQFQAIHNTGSLGESFDRMERSTKIDISKLEPWTTKLELSDGMTITPDGLEYYTKNRHSKPAA